MYCTKDCQIKDWKAHKPVCKCNRAFVLSKQTEDYFDYLNHNTASYFREKFAGNEEGYERYKGHFDKLGRINSGACFPGRGIDSFTVAVLEIVRGVDFIKLKALAELTGKECFDDPALHLETMKGLMQVLEKRHAEGKPTTEEDILDGVLALGSAHAWTQEWGECKVYFRRAKEGFVRLLGEDSVKAVDAALAVASQLPSEDESIVEFRRLWEMAKVSLPDEAVTYNIANSLGIRMEDKVKYEEAKVFHLAALEGRTRVLGDEHKNTLDALNCMGVLLKKMEDYEGALDYYQQAIRVKEKVLGKSHPSTLTTIMNMAVAYKAGLKDFTKAEEMYRQALDGWERSLGKQHGETKKCARNLAILLAQTLRDKEKTRELVKEYPHLMTASTSVAALLG
jgi:tetratricopeptide (TPR) repeat protein